MTYALAGAERLLLKAAGIKNHAVVIALLNNREAAVEHIAATKWDRIKHAVEATAYRNGEKSVERLNEYTTESIDALTEEAYEDGYEAAGRDMRANIECEMRELIREEQQAASHQLHHNQGHTGAVRWCTEGMCAYVRGHP